MRRVTKAFTFSLVPNVLSYQPYGWERTLGTRSFHIYFAHVISMYSFYFTLNSF